MEDSCQAKRRLQSPVRRWSKVHGPEEHLKGFPLSLRGSLSGIVSKKLFAESLSVKASVSHNCERQRACAFLSAAGT